MPRPWRSTRRAGCTSSTHGPIRCGSTGNRSFAAAFRNGAHMNCVIRFVKTAFLPALTCAALAGQAGAQVVPLPQADAPVAPTPQAGTPTTPPAPTDTVLAEARTAYDATDYERARLVLDAVIAGLGATATSPEQ